MKIITLFISIFFVYDVWANNCATTRAVIDIGQKQTNTTVAKIDSCKNKITKIIYQKSTSIEFHKNLKNKRPLEFDEIFLKKASESLDSLYKKVKGFTPNHISVLVPDSFKEVSNATTFLKRFKAKYKLRIFYPSKKLRSSLNLLSTYSMAGEDIEKYLVWNIDLDGTSLIYFDKGTFHFFHDNINSSHFKNMVLKGIKTKNDSEKATPNPIGESDLQKAIRMISLHSKFSIPSEFLEGIKNKVLVGIGELHYKGLAKLINNKRNYYTINDIKKSMEKHKDSEDYQIKVPSPEEQMTNLILIYGQIQTLGKESFLTLKVNPTFSALFHHEFWK